LFSPPPFPTLCTSLSLHDALPISPARRPPPPRSLRRGGGGCRSLRAPAPAAGPRSSRGRRGHAVEGTQLEPLVDRGAVLSGCGRELTGELDRSLGALHVDDHPPGDEVLGLRE